MNVDAFRGAGLLGQKTTVRTRYGRLVLPCSLQEWFRQALHYPGIQLMPLTPRSLSSPPDCLTGSIVIRPKLFFLDNW